MFTSNKLVALFSAVFAAVAVKSIPFDQRATNADGTIKFCTGPLFSGNCSSIAYTSGTCYNFPAGFHDSITSITPLSDNVCCYAYLEQNCQGNVLAFRNPGPSDLGPGWDDTFDSVRCTISDVCPLW